MDKSNSITVDEFFSYFKYMPFAVTNVLKWTVGACVKHFYARIHSLAMIAICRYQFLTPLCKRLFMIFDEDKSGDLNFTVNKRFVISPHPRICRAKHRAIARTGSAIPTSLQEFVICTWNFASLTEVVRVRARVRARARARVRVRVRVRARARARVRVRVRVRVRARARVRVRGRARVRVRVSRGPSRT